MPRARKTMADGKPPTAVNGTPSASAGRARKAVHNASPAQAALAPTLTADEIARRAYEIYEQSGFRQGRDLDHWLIAERELQGF